MSDSGKTLVIDACIAGNAGEISQAPDSSNAREFLYAVRNFSHQVGMTTAILAEWDKHQSSFSRSWRVDMANRGRLIVNDVQESEELRNKINDLNVDAPIKAIMLKDCHLLEAAMFFDQRIVSSEKKAHRHFKNASAHISEIQNLLWVNPLTDAEAAQTWLKEGAPDKPEWQLRR